MIDRRLFVAGAAASLAAPAVRAQSLPTQPVRIIVGSRPGVAPTSWRGWWARSWPTCGRRR